MPTYTFKNKLTGEEWTEIMSISERDEFLEECDFIEQLIVSAPGIVAGSGKPSDAFRDKLREIKKANPGSNVNTF